MSYSSFRKANNDIEQLKNRFNKLDGKREFNDLDDTYWTINHVGGPEGVGEAVVRFLPAPPDGQGGQEPDNIVKYFNFSIFKDGKAYINRGRNTLGADEADPANDYNKSIWARKDISKDEKKKLLINRGEYYIANVYIVKDPNKPENVGKVFRWRFGRQIYNLINKQLFPEFETDSPCNVFDPIDGADFHLRVTQKTIPDQRTGELKKVPNYENSKFANPSARWTLDEFDAIWSQEHSLQSEIAEDKFKSYEDLKKQFDRVMGITDDFNEPYTKPRESTKVKEQESAKTMSETLDDEVPWLNDVTDSKTESSDDRAPWDVDEETTTDTTSSSSDEEVDPEDWFANIK